MILQYGFWTYAPIFHSPSWSIYIFYVNVLQVEREEVVAVGGQQWGQMVF